MKQIYCLVSALFIFQVSFCQGIKGLQEKAKKAAAIIKKADDINRKVQDVKYKIEGPATFIATSGDAKANIYLTQSESYCGYTQNKTKTRELIFRNSNNQEQRLFIYKEGKDCYLPSDEQIQSNTDNYSSKSMGRWLIAFISEPSKKIIQIKKVFTDDMLSNISDLKDKNTIDTYKLIGDTVYFISKETNEKSSKEQVSELGNWVIRFENGEVYDNTNKKIYDYTGGNNFDLMSVFVSYRFYSIDMKLAKNIRDIINKRDYRVQKENNDKFSKEVKNCKFCNKEYTGESYDFDLIGSSSKSGPCGYSIVAVYRKAFCSRKCALEECNLKN
jgi:hypothetical protein